MDSMNKTFSFVIIFYFLTLILSFKDHPKQPQNQTLLPSDSNSNCLCQNWPINKMYLEQYISQSHNNKIISHFIQNIIQHKNMENRFKVVADDPALEAFQETFRQIHEQYNDTLKTLQKNEGGILKFSEGYRKFGIHQENDEYVYRQWAPMAQEIYLYGQFNNWQPYQHKAIKDQFGNWELKIKGKIYPYSLLKARVKLSDGSMVDRVPAWINHTRQNQYNAFDGAYCPSNYKFKYQNPQWENDGLKIYECHVGMSGIDAKIYTYKHFRENIVDRIADLGYNVIQLMGIAQHPFYGSFGYHVSSFFAPSSRFGTPDELKQLIDYAHSKNLKVLMDVVHAHAVKNVGQGLNMWDGTDYQYFHALPQGHHTAWDSRIFDYGKYQVQRFLLSNINYWMLQFRIDGYRFDGITSMLYKHHGINYAFTGNNHEYFGQYLDRDALVYMMLANNLVHQLNPKSISIAEDVSGMPGLCRNIDEGGFGFDFRLAMGIPDMWYKLLREVPDQNWKISNISFELANRRYKEKTIAYSESHDQAFVGDKTISHWLFNEQIYTQMSTQKQETPKIFRGMALHKMIRLITISLGGEGYLNFMGNQFGHPEWIDFPRQGNGWSLKFCRRRWDLADNKNLRFHHLQNFDKAMINLQSSTHFMNATHNYISLKHDDDHVLVFQKDNLLFVFNFHPVKSFQDYLIPCEFKGIVQILLDTDRADFGGHSRIQIRQYKTEPNSYCGRQNSFKMYLPSRSAIVFSVKQ